MQFIARTGARAALLIAATTLIATGCRGRQPDTAAAETRSPAAGGTVPASSAAPATLAAGTPQGGLADWIGDVERGLSRVVASASSSPADASKNALDLYLTRQEYIEMYWGAGGRLGRGAALGPAVKEAETRFHLLLSRFQPGRPVDPAVLRADVQSLSAQYGRVLELAKSSGAPLDPHVLPPSGGGSGAR